MQLVMVMTPIQKKLTLKLLRKYLAQTSSLFFYLQEQGQMFLPLLSYLNLNKALSFCVETAHINVDETGAPEHFCGCKLITVGNYRWKT